ncbi:MAG: hypothetical protein LUB59_07440 [Candidatus Gastranaerophilales bacterium]|nr:hypothetical protein [Candidatus Gastranaerophilales bacterium]
MGMAASQARYLALTARKSNCEYEGQQINQARTALANQSADYFNRLLETSVPDCPDSTDYTTLQYSYSDGYNDTVLENWYQLSTANSDYNYVVDTYYYADVYTGSEKKLVNPEVLYKEDVISSQLDVGTLVKNSDGSYTLNNDVTYESLSQYSSSTELQNALKDLESEGYLSFDGGEIDYSDLYGYKDSSGVWHITTADDLESATSNSGLKSGYVDLTQYGLDLTDTSSWTDDDFETVVSQLEEAGLTGISKDDIIQAVSDGAFETGYASYTSTTVGDETSYSFESATKDEAYEEGTGGLTEYSTVYAPTYVGNCQLTELTDSLGLSDETALLQILADNPDSSIADYITRNADGTYEYCGSGIYTYTYNGNTCYTTYEDLINSLTTYDNYGQPIENQDKLTYYTASYINSKISDTSYALLETDGSGRFTSLKLEDDSVVYTLNVESVTDEDAYNNAMNQYYHDVQEYEKTVADINAKTEIIQQEDRTLELRLKQLDTEQNALQTEMEAVQKVISKNVETTFKTFSGS